MAPFVLLGNHSVKYKVTAFKTVHRYKSLHTAGQLYKHAPGRYAADHTGKDLPDMLTDIFRHIAVFRRTLRGHCPDFQTGGFLGSILSKSGKVTGNVRRAFLFGQCGQNPVNGGIGVTADGGSKVAVVRQSQTEVADGLCGISGLVHGAEQLVRDDPLCGRSLHTIQNRGKVPGFGLTLMNLLGTDAQCIQQLHQRINPALFRLTVYSIDKGDSLFCGQLCRSLIGADHQLFDHFLCFSTVTGFHIHAHAVFVQRKVGLYAFQLHISPLFCPAFQNISQLPGGVQSPNYRGILLSQLFGSGFGKNLIDLTVNAPHFGMNHAFAELIFFHVALSIQMNDGGKGQLILPCIQRTHAVGQSLRQHGNYTVGKINGSAPGNGFLIQPGTLFDIMGHVGNVYAQLISAGAGAADGNGVVQVFCRSAVNGENRQLPQIQTAFQVFLLHALFTDTARFFQHFLRENGGNLVLFQNSVRANPGTGTGTVNFLYPSKQPISARTGVQLRHDLVALFGSQQIPIHNGNIISDGVIRPQGKVKTVPDDSTRRALFFFLQNPDNAAAGTFGVMEHGQNLHFIS